MKKIITIIILLLIITGIGIFGIIHLSKNQKNINNNLSQKTYKKTEKKEINTAEKKEKINTHDKMKEIRKKLALKGLIQEGDMHLVNKEYTTALTKYLKINKELPDDKMTIKKIGDSYFYLKRYKQAYKYYSKIKDFKYLDKDTASLSLIYSNKINTGSLDFLNNELSTLNLDKQNYFYYTNSFKCIQNYDLCIENFEKYFKDIEDKNIKKHNKNKNKNQDTDSGSLENTASGALNNKIITLNDNLKNIKSAIENYKNSQSEGDLVYKNALITGAFFENGLYPVSINIGKKILEEHDDYRAILKIVAKSYYELGNYIEAKDYLLKYKKLDTNNAEISYFLGVVYEKLNEETLSIIHFDKAIKQGYKDSLNARRRIIYAYYNIGETDKMLKVFKDIFKYNKEKLNIDDLSMAIYYHILNNKIEKAKEFSEYGIITFPKSEKFYAYLAWIEVDELDGKINKLKIDKIEQYIQKGLKINHKSPMINFVKGKLELIKGDYKKAYIYFKETVNNDYNGDFGKIAQGELDKLELIKQN